MANPHRGDVRLVAKDREVTLRASINALCAIEDRFAGRPAGAIIVEIDSADGVRLNRLRAVLCELMRHHHPDTSIAQAGEIIEAAGIMPAAAAVRQAIERAFPPADAATPGKA